MRKIKFSRYGMAENPKGYHVALPFRGRTLLGEVLSFVNVRHFNGEMWPIQAAASAVDVIG